MQIVILRSKMCFNERRNVSHSNIYVVKTYDKPENLKSHKNIAINYKITYVIVLHFGLCVYK